MRCDNVEKACDGNCPCQPEEHKDPYVEIPKYECLCTAEWSPVCGTNGNTYGNACAAKCVNVDIQCNNACPCQMTRHLDRHVINECNTYCFADPCQFAKCERYPHATCESRCCDAVFYVNGEEVSCGKLI